MHFIVGDPIAQVKSPAGVTAAFHSAGRDAVVVPAHVPPADLAAWVAGVGLQRNADGIIVTVPHKFACFDLCATTSDRAAFLHTVNTLRRNPDGTWHGDMFDGLGYVAAMQGKGCEPAGKKALLVGAGGAGSAIAHALVVAGVSHLAIHDEDATRRTTLVERLAGLGLCPATHGSIDPTGFDIVLNATPEKRIEKRTITERVPDDETDEHTEIAINLIPHTLDHTTLGTLAVGSRVNLEIDLIARYVERMLGDR